MRNTFTSGLNSSQNNKNLSSDLSIKENIKAIIKMRNMQSTEHISDEPIDNDTGASDLVSNSD
jgi:DNA-directed RNA polymerase specialized sigma54-like protein